MRQDPHNPSFRRSHKVIFSWWVYGGGALGALVVLFQFLHR
jgi:uncharacterized membrane protein YdcZ (DUF606 family)